MKFQLRVYHLLTSQELSQDPSLNWCQRMVVQMQPGNLRFLLPKHKENRIGEFTQFRQVINVAQIEHLQKRKPLSGINHS